jgi:hypothetical protein
MGLILPNGVSYSWRDIVLTALGKPFIGITDIEFDRDQVKKLEYGAGSEPYGMGFGNADYKASVEIYQEELKNLIAIAPARDILLIPFFTIKITYGNTTQAITTDTLVNCQFTKDAFKASQGNTSLKIKLPIVFSGLAR